MEEAEEDGIWTVLLGAASRPIIEGFVVVASSLGGAPGNCSIGPNAAGSLPVGPNEIHTHFSYRR